MREKGQSLIEILVSLSILSVVLLMFVASVVNLSNSQINSRARAEATHHAREGIEIAYSISLHDWERIVNMADSGSVYHPIITQSGDRQVYGFAPGDQLEGGKFLRRIEFEYATRDPIENNISNTGEADPSTVMVTSTVQWTTGGNEDSVQFVTYLIDFATAEALEDEE